MDDLLNSQKSKIVKLLKEKSVMKQDVYHNTMACFEMVKQAVNEISEGLLKETQSVDNRITISVNETKKYSIQLKVAGDILEFFMHTNVFQFDKSHPMYKTAYIKENDYNSFCGIINIYNFLSDSFLHNRFEDLGYLVCRIFINRENKFFIETGGPIGIKYANFSFEPISKNVIKEIINELIIYAVTFDLFTPPFEAVREVSVGEMQEKVSSINLRTGKRLGFSSSSSIVDEDNNLYI